MSQNVESEISKIDDFLKQLGGGGGQELSSSSSKGIVSKFRECFVCRIIETLNSFSTASILATNNTNVPIL